MDLSFNRKYYKVSKIDKINERRYSNTEDTEKIITQ